MEHVTNKTSITGTELARPLADRMRPTSLDEFVGQSQLLSPGKALYGSIINDQVSSMIFWGPPGTGKTSLAHIIALKTRADFFNISAVTSGVAEVRKIITTAEKSLQNNKRTILFIDEIHRFNKAQQDALLHSVENGTLILIGATTENPSFEVISPLLSRCRVYKLEPLGESELGAVIDRCMQRDAYLLSLKVQLLDDARTALIKMAAGDARSALTALELSAQLTCPDTEGNRLIDLPLIQEAMQKRTLYFDKQGDYHYDIISAFIKSVRGSDPDAALFWLARLLEAGEDPLFIARRLIVLASEDIGNADPHGLMVATSAYTAVHYIGMPEARIILSQATTYLACAPKSNAGYLAIEAAAASVRDNPAASVPLHLRNAPTRLMKDMGYAQGYKYPHNFEGFIDQNYFPPEVSPQVYYRPTNRGIEARIKDRLMQLWPRRKR